MTDLSSSNKPPFNETEIRVLGSLMEKALTTPNNYPLTMNSLTLACNQKSSREPPMNLSEGDVGHCTRALIEFGYITLQNSGRAQRVEHKLDKKWQLSVQQQAVLAVLMLRAPQTINEIKTRTERMADFADKSEIQAILDAWIEGDTPWVLRIPAGAGQREDRYFHLLGKTEAEALLETWQANSAKKPTTQSAAQEELIQRVEALEERIAKIEAMLD